MPEEIKKDQESSVNAPVQDPVDQNVDKGSVNQSSDQEGKTKDSVSYETYQKTMKDLKKAQAKNKELDDKIEIEKTNQLEEKEEFKALYETEKSKSDKKDEALKKKEVKALFAKSFHDPNDAVQFMDLFEFDEEFNVTNGTEVLEKLKKEKPYLFVSEGNQTPVFDSQTSLNSGKKKSIDDMTPEEYKEAKKKGEIYNN